MHVVESICESLLRPARGREAAGPRRECAEARLASRMHWHAQGHRPGVHTQSIKACAWRRQGQTEARAARRWRGVPGQRGSGSSARARPGAPASVSTVSGVCYCRIGLLQQQANKKPIAGSVSCNSRPTRSSAKSCSIQREAALNPAAAAENQRGETAGALTSGGGHWHIACGLTPRIECWEESS